MIPLINTPFWTISNKFTGTSTSSFHYGKRVHETKQKDSESCMTIGCQSFNGRRLIATLEIESREKTIVR